MLLLFSTVCLSIFVQCQCSFEGLTTPPHHKGIPQDVMVGVVNRLGLKMLAVHNQNNENNIAISPYGTLAVLVALQEGVRGPAADEIFLAADIPPNPSLIRIGLRDIHRHLKSYFIPKEGFLAGLTLNQGNISLSNEYKEILDFYGLDIGGFNKDFYDEFFKAQGNDSVVLNDNGMTTTEVNPEATTVVSNSNPMSEVVTTIRPSSESQSSTDSVSSTSGSPNDESSTPTTVVEMGSNEVTTPSQVPVEPALTTTPETSSAIETSPESTPSDQSPSTETADTEPDGLPAATTGTEAGVVTTSPDVELITESSGTELSTAGESVTITTVSSETEAPDVENGNNGVSATESTSERDDAENGSEAPNNETPTETAPTEENESEAQNNETSTETSPAEGNETDTEATEIEASAEPTEEVPDEAETVAAKRSARSVEDYVIAKYFDSLSITQRPPPLLNPYTPHPFRYHPPLTPAVPFPLSRNDRPQPDVVYDEEESSADKDYEVSMDYMSYDTVLPYFRSSTLSASALKFPLDNPNYYLLLLLPNQEADIDHLVQNLGSYDSLSNLVENLRDTRVQALIPGFTLKGIVVLTNTLQKLGIRRVFEPQGADFSKMTLEPDIYITNIEQAISVNIKNFMEAETDKEKKKRNLQQYDTAEFTADHPFLYFVMDTELHVCLMAGKINNPLNSRIS